MEVTKYGLGDTVLVCEEINNVIEIRIGKIIGIQYAAADEDWFAYFVTMNLRAKFDKEAKLFVESKSDTVIRWIEKKVVLDI